VGWIAISEPLLVVAIDDDAIELFTTMARGTDGADDIARKGDGIPSDRIIP